MSSENTVTLVGNVTRQPELRFTASGLPVTEFGIAINNRRYNRDTQQYEDGDPKFFDISCWKDLAENVADCVEKGTRVTVTGRLDFRQWETEDGDRRSKVSVVADDVAVSLRWATVEVQRNDRSSSGGSSSKPAYDPEAPF